MLVLAGAGVGAVFVLLVTRAVSTAPDATGVVTGILGSAFAALLVAAFAAWTLIWAFADAAPATIDRDRVADLDIAMESTVDEVESLRADVAQAVRRRTFSRVPIGVLGGAAVWILMQWSDDPPSILALVIFAVIGAMAAEGWAIFRPDQTYRRQYKDRVLPRLVAGFGALTYRAASADLVSAAASAGILPAHEQVVADDEIAGTHRGVPIRIVEVRLETGAGDETVVPFDGLLVEIPLRQLLGGRVLIVGSKGAIRDALTPRLNGLPHVPIEDDRFSGRYRVFAAERDDVSRLLTSSFRQRFVELDRPSATQRPRAFAEQGRLVVAMPKQDAVDLFEPPGYWKAPDGEVLDKLRRDITTALTMADAVIDLLDP